MLNGLRSQKDVALNHKSTFIPEIEIPTQFHLKG